MRRFMIVPVVLSVIVGCDGLYYELTLPHPPPFPDAVTDHGSADVTLGDAPSVDDVIVQSDVRDVTIAEAGDALTPDAPDVTDASDVTAFDADDVIAPDAPVVPDGGMGEDAVDAFLLEDHPDVATPIDVVDVVTPPADRPDVVSGMDVVDVHTPEDRPDVMIVVDRPDVVDAPVYPDVRDAGPETMPDSGPPTVTLYFRYAAFSAPPIEIVRMSMVPRNRELIDFPFRDAECIGGLQNGVTLFGEPGWMSCRIEVWGTAPTTPEFTLFWRVFPLPEGDRCYDALYSVIEVGTRLHRLRDLEISNGGGCIGGGLMGTTYAGRFYTNGFRVRFPLPL